MRADLFILNYNGADFISQTIESFLEAVRRSSYRCQLIVIDNKSEDQSVSLIKRTYDSLPVMEMGENRVLCSFNKAVERSRADIVFLLNNDLKADPNFIDPVIRCFETYQDAFLVASKSFLWNGSYEGGRAKPFIKFGFFGTTCQFKGFENLIDTPGSTFAAGFGAFDREKFLRLDGFDDLYLPGRLEDADIALRAWRSGWKCYYEPKSILYHMGGKSFKTKFGECGTLEIAHKNTFLFMWKNVHDTRFWVEHWTFLIPRLLWNLLKGKPEFVTGFFKALKKMRFAFEKRECEKNNHYLYSDRCVISFFQNGH